MDIVVETTLVVKASWLPELAAHLPAVVPVQNVLRQEADSEKSHSVSLSTREEASEIPVILHVALVGPHLEEAVD